MTLMLTIICMIVVLCQPGLSKTAKQKRDLADMPTNYLYEYGEGSAIYDDDLNVYFYVTYDKKFNDDWLTLDSQAFLDEAALVESAMVTLFANAMGLSEEELSVELIGFIPSPTKAEILLKIPAHLHYTDIDVVNYLAEMDSYGSIDGAQIMTIDEQMGEYYFDSQMTTTESIIVELTYDFDTSNGSIDLSDPYSEAFQNEAKSLKNQLVLLLIDKLANQGTIATPDQIELEVSKFVSEGTYTNAELVVRPKGIDIEQLSFALQFLAINADVRINGRPIIALEELEREISYGDPDEPSMKVMNDDYFGPLEPVPPDDLTITGEVMDEKEPINGDLYPDIKEAIPPDDYIYEPDIISPSRGDGGQYLNGFTNERIPSDTVDEIAEPTPPDETTEPVPTEAIQYCSAVEKPVLGEMECVGDNMEGSICQFTCADETRMEGPDTIVCTAGYWNADPPVCRRIFCEPYYQRIEDGQTDCTNNNLFASVCMFTCNSEFRLVGNPTIICQRDQTWTEAAPYCEPEPVICDDEYGEWSECADGERVKEAVSVTRGFVTTNCPRVKEDCVDCQLAWTTWSACDGEMVRFREQYVVVEKVGAGEECAEPKVDSQKCKDCVIEWGNYTDCQDEERSRTQYIVQSPVGGAECPPLDFEQQGCFDCEVEWGPWSACIEGYSTRDQFILAEAVNGGEACPELGHEEEDCQNCSAEWDEWTPCVDGVSRRSQYIVQNAYGRGDECSLQTEEEDCADCRVAWSGWSSCENGFSERVEVVTQAPIGRGEICPELQNETRECVNCRLEWGDWEACIEGNRRRLEFVAEEAVGAGTPCEEPSIEFQECTSCEVRWGEWSECSGDYRTRTEVIFQPPINAEPCRELYNDTEPCVDCSYTWGEWEECQFGLERRYLTIEVEPVGAGEQCPEEQAQTRECCYLEWSDWSECEDGARTRIQEILIEPEDVACPEPMVDSESCENCELAWGAWSTCENNRISRTQVVITEAVGGGQRCPEVQTETEYCADCVVEWGDWSECIDGIRERLQVVVEDRVGAGEDCPPIQFEGEDCADCIWEQTEWSNCSAGQRYRDTIIIQPAQGVGEACPVANREYEDCVDCVVEWGDWSQCENGQSARVQVVVVSPVGAGKKCPELELETDVCVDCVLEWEEWSECSDGVRTRSQFIATDQQGQGRTCPSERTVSEDCVDCVVEWGPWTTCFSKMQRREQRIATEAVGAGEPCPTSLGIQSRECSRNDSETERTMCRFVDIVLGWKRVPVMRDLLLLGDESGSIGWLNFEKIKNNFKSIARNIRGGIGTQETQVAMSSFARYSRIIFDFDDYHDVNDISNAIDEVIYKGGFRSRIGGALSDVNTWVFQQSAGMRSFPNLDDNIDHEVLIATDGCRTYDAYHIKKGLKALRSRGIKLFVLAIAAKDERCQKTIKSMVDDNDNLFELESWEDLVELTRVIEDRACVTSTQDEADYEDEP